MKKLGLITSKGGHLFQLYLLKSVWEKYDRFWITFKGVETESLLKNEHVFFGYYPESRNAVNAVKNFFFAVKILREEKPNIIISTGAAIAPPFFLAAKILKIKTVFIEPFDFISFPSLSGRLCYPLADFFFVQHKAQLKFFPKALFKGSIL